MKFDVITLFPEMIEAVTKTSIIGRAQKTGQINVVAHNLRDFTTNKRKTVDDTPYGGGPGMVLKVDVIDRALQALKCKKQRAKCKIILLTPQGKVFHQKMARRLSKYDQLVLVCGHYEGFDERVRNLVDEEISIGDYILTGGELPALVLIDAISRLIPGVLGKKESSQFESFSPLHSEPYPLIPVLEYPQYTRPVEYEGLKIPKILVSGNHQKILEWRQKQSLKRTIKRRPDLMKT